jgi:hypothetical protein
MDSAKRSKNEKEFEKWDELPEGGRKYYFEVRRKMGGFARYIKITDANEITVSFVQEIYDDSGNMTSVHEKYPIDKGHQKV